MEAMQTYRLKGASGSVSNQVFDLRQRTVIGRADDCDLRLADEACAPHHCEIACGGDGALVLKQIDNAPGFATRVNGRTVECTELLRGDEIRIGACRWVVQAPGLRPQRVLTGAAVQERRSRLPWLLAAAALAAVALAWQRGWIPL